MLTLCHNFFQVIPNNKNNKDTIQHVSKRKFVFGLFLLLLVDILWVVSSELTKYLYTEKKIERPFLITYIRSSVLFVYLLVLCFTPPTRDPCRPADYTQLLEQSPETDDEHYFNEANSSLGDSTFVPVRAGETTDSDDAAPRAVRFNKVAEVRVMSAREAGEALLARLSWAASVRASEFAQRKAAAAATRRHLRLAATLILPWFVSNYLYRLSLVSASTCSATVLASAWSALAAALGACAGDRFGLSKGIAVLLTAAAFVVLGVSGEGRQTSWTAVLAALGSAVFYATHLMLLRRELRKGEAVNSPLLVGIVGCICGLMAWSLGGVLAAADVERASLPPPRLWSWLLLDAAFGPLLLDSLWLWGRSLTSSSTATGMLSLCLPLAGGVSLWRGEPGGALAAALAAAAAAALLAAPRRLAALLAAAVTTHRPRPATMRNLEDLDEQSEALISQEEPT